MAEPHRLSEGAVIRASILARLLGIRLLRVDADIALVPAIPPGPVVVEGTTVSAVGGLDEAAALLRRASRTLEAAR